MRSSAEKVSWGAFSERREISLEKEKLRWPEAGHCAAAVAGVGVGVRRIITRICLSLPQRSHPLHTKTECFESIGNSLEGRQQKYGKDAEERGKRAPSECSARTEETQEDGEEGGGFSGSPIRFSLIHSSPQSAILCSLTIQMEK